MNRQAFVVPGGFSDHPPGLAAFGALLLSTPVTGTPVTRAASEGRELGLTLASRALQVTLSSPDPRDTPARWLSTDPATDRITEAFTPLHRRNAQRMLSDPVERSLHRIETAAWGTSRWSEYWGAEELQFTGQDVTALIGAWASAPPRDEPFSAAFPSPDHRYGEWAPGPLHHDAPTRADDTSTRTELAIAVPLTGEGAPMLATVAATLLGAPQTGRLFHRLRIQRALAYGIAAIPVVRGRKVALLAAASTTTANASECARHLADEVRELLSAPPAPDQVADARTALARQVSLAHALLEAGETLGPVHRSLLEADCTTATSESAPATAAFSDHLPAGVRPQWAVHGPVPDQTLGAVEQTW
ncbi:insulinase family protein [Kitasatospora sp. NPDC057936]|uniref:insulinase family protein n=1 Tax=Kitasatospora sp. NPDC057936 TaxID=3346283 RepID=UPI0036D86019